jgi:hypothetical protein
VLAIVGIGAAGAAVAVLASKKSSSSNNNNPPPTPTTGDISITVPNPSIVGTILRFLGGLP